MYAPDTILKLKEPRSKGKPDAKGYEPFAYDRVKVLGESPIVHSGGNSSWEGASARGVLIEPLTAFDSNLDEPIGKLQMLYDVESEPAPRMVPLQPQVRYVEQAALGPSPEEFFAAQAKANPQPPQKHEFRSPLADAAREAARAAEAESAKRTL